MNYSQDTTSSLSELPISQDHFENLVTYELVRASINSGFGFDLKGDRPCVIGTVRKGSIADQVGLQEGDVVIAINNKKVTEYDHDQVVRLVGMSKNKLVVQVTKIKISPKVYKIKKPKSSGYKATTIGIAPHFYPGSSRKKSRSRRKMNTTHSSQSTASSSGFGPDLTTNTKTTEDDEDESDLEFYYGTNGSSGRRRKHHHQPLHHHKARIYSRKPKRAVRSVPQAVTNSEYVEFYEIEDVETDTEDTEDTEENLVDFKIPKPSRKIRNNNYIGCKQKVPISAKKIAYQQLKKSRKELDPSSMPPPVLTSTFHLNTKEKIVNNVSIESSELEYEPAYAPINPVKSKNQKVSPQYIIYSSSKAINSKTKQVKKFFIFLIRYFSNSSCSNSA